ncbi:hypothetical protein [Tautonia sociabilis]|uniref:Four-helix bundle copper-binding protein n=1 Tax=Tautonia sociabilis TaxID=2080755 RepID=A0A432MI67_9BACT|nr:hypothetical protein [Tautonia sociabilis]RUL87053.1 hypothetical protein TsocGM_14015 [Tautonia sociabilis]
MQRRQMLGTIGMGTAAFAIAGTSRAASPASQGHEGADRIMAECAEACARAASHCLEQLRQQSGDAEKHARALAYAASCEKFCLLSYAESACGSPLAHLAHEANAQACQECARACEGIEGQVMRDCVSACRQCAEHCRQLARQANQGR